MRGRFRVPMAVIAGALLGLIALLATLQYRWLGQISGAERDRMKATLNNRATAFARDVDAEVTRAYLLFQLDATPEDQAPTAALSARYDRWQASARFPRMIKDVYLATASETDGARTLQRFNPSTRFLEPVEWPRQLADVRRAFETPSVPVGRQPEAPGTTFVMRAPLPSLWASAPALVIAAPVLMVGQIDKTPDLKTLPLKLQHTSRFTIVLLDRDYMRGEMLPAIAQQHFQRTGDGFDYQLAVVPASGGQPPVFRSVPDFAPAPDASADAKVDLFQIRPRDFEPIVAEVTRFTMLSAIPRDLHGGIRTGTFVRESISRAPRSNVTVSPAPFSIVVQSTGRSSTGAEQRIGAMLSGAAASMSARAGGQTPAEWRLIVSHPAGSLERAVGAARRRNLAISTSILGILGVSVGFLVLSTRRAHALARQQLEFVATVSHELRTPLAVIRSAADNLADGVVDDEDRVRQYGQLVRREGMRLTDLVEQILEFAGLQAGERTLTPAPVQLAPLLRDVVATAQATAPSSIEVDLSLADNLPAVAGDEAALRRVFQNLVGNAIKYGADACWIGIRAAAAGAMVDVSVSDRGIGIAAGDQERIFDPFYRAPNVVAAQIQGAGLGLSLVRRIVEAHAGRISVTSAPGQGSTFTVSLPVAAGDTASAAGRVGEAAAQPL